MRCRSTPSRAARTSCICQGRRKKKKRKKRTIEGGEATWEGPAAVPKTPWDGSGVGRGAEIGGERRAQKRRASPSSSEPSNAALALALARSCHSTPASWTTPAADSEPGICRARADSRQTAGGSQHTLAGPDWQGTRRQRSGAEQLQAGGRHERTEAALTGGTWARRGPFHGTGSALVLSTQPGLIANKL